MSCNATIRAIQSAQRREERAAQKRFRELQRKAKEQAKLSALEQARLEVERHENELELLLSVHKECGASYDWLALGASLPPLVPRRFSHQEAKARHDAGLVDLRHGREESSNTLIAEARLDDEQAFQSLTQAYSILKAEWEQLHKLAPRVLAGEPEAYIEALSVFNPFVELDHLGSSIHFTVHDARLIECVLKIKGRDVIPAESKSLTAAGKLSVKGISKNRFHEIYHDYVCGCVLRVAREVFALLPIDTVLITASVDAPDSSSGNNLEKPVLSVAISRAAHQLLNYDGLDPSDAIESFPHRGDFKASRKSGDFAGIASLTPADVTAAPIKRNDLHDFVRALQRHREEIRREIESITRKGNGELV